MKEREPTQNPDEEPQPLFELGQVVTTPGFFNAVARTGDHPLEYLFRHVTGDWGDLGDEDKHTNDMALQHNGRIFSVYHMSDNTRFYVITEYDRSVTTFLLPNEY